MISSMRPSKGVVVEEKTKEAFGKEISKSVFRKESIHCST
jgi:hypothetical protein